MARIGWLCLLAVFLETRWGLGQSLSRLKTVTMSSQFQNWNGSRAVDGNYNRKSSICECCAATSTDLNLVDQWMEIDLGETTEFNRVVVYGQNNGTFQRQNLIGLAIHVDSSETTIASIEDTGQDYVNFYHFDLGQKYSARRIKLILKGSNKVLVICEVDVFNDYIISNGKNVTAISTFGDWSPSLAVDSDNRTNADVCLCCAATDYDTDPWINVDLGDVYLITYIQMYGRTDEQPEGQSFEGMNVTVDDVVIQTAPTTGTFTSYYDVFPKPEKIGRNVKFTLTGKRRLLVICEVVIYGDRFKGRVLSHRKLAEISSRFYGWDAARAVDGNYRSDAGKCHCCTATEYQQDPNYPWLRVDLGFEHRITRVVIYGRTDGQWVGQNFVGMTIQMDSTVVHTIPTSANWIDFYEYPLATVRLATSVTLTLVGPNEQLVVCELLVYGDCKKSFFNDSCSTQCHCEGDPCPSISGICPSGRCKPGYQTETCSKPCPDGRYGYNCSETCGNCRNSQICNSETGECHECEDGYTFTDVLCKTACDAGEYGQNCSIKCGNCKDDHICDHVTGYCDDCKPGYILTDPLCKTPCTDGRYGYNCSETCGKCRDGETCTFETGLCTQCEDGYKYSDRLCKTVCNDDSYGTNCSNTCGNCRDAEICNKVNGHCAKCEDGYKETDKTCKTRCDPGFYGRNCTMQCGSCKDDAPCNDVNGSCVDCMNGTFVFNDRLCNKDCEHDTYGYNCTESCGNCRENAFCSRVNGTCADCEDGYISEDKLCNTVCGWGTYGFNCENHCGSCFGNVTCDRVNGSCFECVEGYFGMLCAEPLVQSPDGDDDSNTVVIIGAIIPVVLIIAVIAVVVVVVIKKRRPYKQHQGSPTAQPDRIYENTEVFNNVVAIQNEDQEPSVPVEENNDHDYYAFTKNVPGISIHQLWDYIATNKGEGFLNEYETLKEGLLHPHNDAITNRKKNRYREMFPYDHSRVHLKVERPGESEFINASHIDGFERKGKFIASQGPIDVMVVDFWRMVWQQNTRKIVMLTNLVENGHNKCMQYWPDEETDEYERISIKMVKEDKTSDYAIKTLDIAQDDAPPRRIKQYHYKAWPDKDVPDSTWSLTQFWREVFRDEDKGPVVVHCSAGVGRTGTFIAMDNLYHQAITKGIVTPLKVVERLRDQRVKMVQTSEQYEFLHEAVADTLLFGTHYLWQSQYPAYCDFMMKTDRAIGGKVRLTHQFELLKKSLTEKPLRANGGETKSNAKECDEYKPKGSTRAGTGKQCPKFLPSLGGSDSFLLTTVPDAKTLAECLRLVDEHNVRTVITVMDVAQQVDSIWGSINTQNIDKYKPVLASNKTVGFVTERSFTYSKQTKTQASKQHVKVKQMELKLSTSADPAKQAESVARVFDVISEWHPYISTKEPVLIQCRDGVTYCGIMAVLLNEKLRILKNGGQVHILDSVMTIKSADQSMILSYNQYKFIHDILLHVLKEKDPLYSEADAAEADLDDENIYQNT